MNKYFSITAYYFNGDVDLFWFYILLLICKKKKKKYQIYLFYDFEWLRLNKYVKNKTC